MQHVLTVLVRVVAGAVRDVVELVEVFVRWTEELVDSPIMERSAAVVFTPGRLVGVVRIWAMGVVVNTFRVAFFSTFAGVSWVFLLTHLGLLISSSSHACTLAAQVTSAFS